MRDASSAARSACVCVRVCMCMYVCVCVCVRERVISYNHEGRVFSCWISMCVCMCVRLRARAWRVRPIRLEARQELGPPVD